MGLSSQTLLGKQKEQCGINGAKLTSDRIVGGNGVGVMWKRWTPSIIKPNVFLNGPYEGLSMNFWWLPTPSQSTSLISTALLSNALSALLEREGTEGGNTNQKHKQTLILNTHTPVQPLISILRLNRFDRIRPCFCSVARSRKLNAGF
jgi:hypothetical protein